MVEEKPIEKPYSLNKFRIPKKKSIDSSDTESDKQVNAKTEVVEKSKKAEKVVVEESKQPLTASKIQPKKTPVETPPSKPVHRLSISKESIDGSDSEPELKIAESDHEEDNKQSPETEKEQTGSSEKSVKSTSGDTTAKDENERGQLTKAMLQNIVASIG